jgi:antitoxin ParD1/3/4/toxin ParE1/3/4
MSGYALHPEAFTDIDEIWEYIAEHNVDAADRVVGEVFDAFRALAASPRIGHRRPDLTARPLRFQLVRTRRTRPRCGSWRFSMDAVTRA